MNNINQPWRLLPNHIKQWVRDNGYVIHESSSGATYYPEWRCEYIKSVEN